MMPLHVHSVIGMGWHATVKEHLVISCVLWVQSFKTKPASIQRCISRLAERGFLATIHVISCDASSRFTKER